MGADRIHEARHGGESSGEAWPSNEGSSRGAVGILTN